MRHLEALAIVLVFAIAASQMLALTARQVYPVHHASAQRAVAWALLSAGDSEELLKLVQLSMGEHLAALYVDGRLLAGGPGTGSTAICYSAVFFEGQGYRVVRVCASP